MANLITKTEAFDDTGAWSANSTTVTANSQAPPTFAGINAGRADTVADNSAAAQGNIIASYVATGVAADTSTYVGSVYIRKDATTTRWPELVLQLNSGPIGEVSLNTSTGATANGADVPTDKGVVDVDADWWRLWLKITNNGAGTDIRLILYPDHLDALGGSTTSVGTGSVVVWGANVTNSTAIETYQPDPAYAFEIPAALIFKNRLA